MIKKMIMVFATLLAMALGAEAQLYAPGYANYQGVGYFTLPNGYYYGQIYAGYPQGEGYYYFVDPQLGPVFYHGYFDRGLCNGQGEVVSSSGYICGTWSCGNFVSQTYVQTQQMQQSYYDVWANYWSFYTTPVYPTTYNWSWDDFAPTYYDWNTYSYPSYNYPTYSYPTYSYPSYDFTYTPSYSTPSTTQTTAEVKIPSNTKITQIDSDTQLGRQLLRKIGR